MKTLLTILSLFCWCVLLRAQESVYIPSSSTVYVGSNSAIGIFGHSINDGNLSVVQNGKVYFLGKIFKNSATARLTDGSTVRNSKQGGNVIFQQPSPYGDLGQQILEAGYNDSLSQGPSFSSVTINNPSGVWMVSDANVLDAVNFENGHVYLNKYIASLGDSTNFGGVNGFNDKRFFVIGTNVNAGSLRINSLENCCVVTYPVGVTKTNYTPIQLRNTRGKNDFVVSAFNNVYEQATAGAVIADTTLKITWSITAKRPGSSSEVEILAQNDVDVETSTFTANRGKSYISLYRNNSWERLTTFNTPQMSGTITSGAAIYTAIMNFRRVNLGSKTMYLTKRVLPGSEVTKYPVYNVFSPNNDGINDKWNMPFLSAFPTCRIQVFNRNGRAVFNSTGYNNPWDGTMNGTPLPVGTYYYVIDLRNGEKPLTGYVVILR